MRDHFFLGRVGILRKQRGCLHDLPGLAVAALRHLLGNPGLLQRMVALGGKAFNGGDLLADRIAGRRLAGAHGLAVDMDRAGTAQTSAATELGSSPFVQVTFLTNGTPQMNFPVVRSIAYANPEPPVTRMCLSWTSNTGISQNSVQAKQGIAL
jgi:hypothetical protein